MKHLHICLIALGLIVVGCSSSGDGEKNVSAIDVIVSDFVGTTPGGADVLRERNGTTDRSSAGIGSSAGEALVSGRPFRVGSISKPFVAVMVLQLVDENVVSLDATLANYLPNTLVGGAITIRQLLSHKSGIANYTDQPAFFQDAFANPERLLTPDEILSYVLDVPAGEVGRFSYSNTNYILLGQLIEQLDSLDLNASLQARISGPLELYNTVFDGTSNVTLPDGLAGGWSSSFGYDGDASDPYSAIASGAWAAGSLISTTDDLATFIKALVAGQLVSSDSFAQMSDTGESDYGLGLQLFELPSGQVFYGHGGSIPGYLSGMAIDPTDSTTLVILTNNDDLNVQTLTLRVMAAE